MTPLYAEVWEAARPFWTARKDNIVWREIRAVVKLFRYLCEHEVLHSKGLKR